METPPSAQAPAESSSEPDDDLLARRAQAGERAALDQLVRRHHPEVARLLWKFARRPADLDDLVQDVFLRVVRHLPQWRVDRPFVHWLRRITVNTGRDYCRRESVRRRWTSEPSADPETSPPEAIEPGSDPAARAAANEAKELLAQLPPDDRPSSPSITSKAGTSPTLARSSAGPAPSPKSAPSAPVSAFAPFSKTKPPYEN